MAAIASASQAGVEAAGVRAAVARPPAALVAAALVGATLVLLPILYTVAEAATVDFRDAVGLLFRPLVGRLLLNTVSLVIAASLATAVIGTAAAGWSNAWIFRGETCGPLSLRRPSPSRPSSPATPGFR